MKKYNFLICVICSLFFSFSIEAQNPDIDSLFQKFQEFYISGDLLKAEETLFTLSGSGETLSVAQLVAVYNNLGVITLMLGKYDKALEYYNSAESMIAGNKQNLKELADIYTNIGHIYNIKRSFDLAIVYFERSIRIYLDIKQKDKNILASLSSAYINLGISMLETDENDSALDYFNKSADLKSGYNLSGLALVYLNIAKTYVRKKDPEMAEKFFIKSINRFTDEFDDNYFRLAEVYFDFGLFLRSRERYNEALEAHSIALRVCLQNYGEKHTLTALAFKHLGDHYSTLNDYRTALEYYQKSLICVVTDFNNNDIFSNPSIDSSLFEIRLLDNLKSKAKALKLLADEQDDITMRTKLSGMGLVTIELALQLIDRIRNEYLTEESQMYLAENEKETYISAIDIAGSLLSLNSQSQNSVKNKMYEIAQKAKAAVLRNEIAGNELLYEAGITQSTLEEQKSLAQNIASCKKLIMDESGNKNPDRNKISLWKDNLFELNRNMEKIMLKINRECPEYYDLLLKTEPDELPVIQKFLRRDETIIDYVLSGESPDGKRSLDIFIITWKNLHCLTVSLDTLFSKNAGIIRKTGLPSADYSFGDYSGALAYMYEVLIKPGEKLFSGHKLIIIPDEELAWLPFDAFLTSRPGPGQKDYEGLHYLINKYTVSYANSSSMISGKEKVRRRGNKVIAFSPNYNTGNNSLPDIEELRGAEKETGSIYRWFRGRKFTGGQASERNFMQAISEQAIFHLAMHAVSDTINSKYSYLLFYSSDSTDEGKLYNYEISLARIRSPLVVLSACNSGTGTLYHGEGQMSLARGFILAGASSVITTIWEINDETSSEIISRFYEYLATGRNKDEALRLAKLEYLKESPPAYSSPFFWAAYEVIGDNAPVTHNRAVLILISIMSLIFVSGLVFLYFRRRRIFSDRLL